MRPLAIVFTVTLLAAVGCEKNPNNTPGYANHESDTWLVKSYNDVAIENVIIRQHTMLPYHFVQNSRELNELGRRDLGILAKHFRKYPGKLNVRKGNISDPLHQARVTTVTNMLSKAGVQTQKVHIADDLPGGDGMSSEEVVVILLNRAEAIPVPKAYGTYNSTMESN